MTLVDTSLSRPAPVRKYPPAMAAAAAGRYAALRVPVLLGLFRITCDELLGLKPLQGPPVRRVTPAELRHLEAMRTLTLSDKRVVTRVCEALRR